MRALYISATGMKAMSTQVDISANNGSTWSKKRYTNLGPYSLGSFTTAAGPPAEEISKPTFKWHSSGMTLKRHSSGGIIK